MTDFQNYLNYILSPMSVWNSENKAKQPCQMYGTYQMWHIPDDDNAAFTRKYECNPNAAEFAKVRECILGKVINKTDNISRNKKK
jgi:hypothetical protein